MLAQGLGGGGGGFPAECFAIDVLENEKVIEIGAFS